VTLTVLSNGSPVFNSPFHRVERNPFSQIGDWQNKTTTIITMPQWVTPDLLKSIRQQKSYTKEYSSIPSWDVCLTWSEKEPPKRNINQSLFNFVANVFHRVAVNTVIVHVKTNEGIKGLHHILTLWSNMLLEPITVSTYSDSPFYGVSVAPCH